MIKETLIISALTATAISAKPTPAQTPAIRGDQAAALLMRVFDKNRDGALDRSELMTVRELMMKRMKADKQSKKPQAKAPQAPKRPEAKAPKGDKKPAAKAPKGGKKPEAMKRPVQRPTASKAQGLRPEQLTAIIVRLVDKNRNGVLERTELMAARDFIVKRVLASKGMKDARGAKKPQAKAPKGPQKPQAKAPKGPKRPTATAPKGCKKPAMQRPQGHGKRPAPCMKGKQAPITITIPQNLVRRGGEQTITITISNKPAKFAPKRAKAGKSAAPRMQCRMMKPQMPMHGKIAMKKCPMVKLQPAVKRGGAKPAMKGQCPMKKVQPAMKGCTKPAIKMQPAKKAPKMQVVRAVRLQPAMKGQCPMKKVQPAMKGCTKPAIKMQPAKKAPKIQVVRAVRLQPATAGKCSKCQKPQPARRK